MTGTAPARDTKGVGVKHVHGLSHRVPIPGHPGHRPTIRPDPGRSPLRPLWVLLWLSALAVRFRLSVFGCPISAVRLWLSDFGCPSLAVRIRL